MAKEPTSGEPQREPKRQAAARTPATPAPSDNPRDRIIDALMALAGERAWDDFGIADVAERAGVSLGTFREHFVSKGAVIAAFSRRIDRIVLDGTGSDLIDEPAKERLFDVLMRRIDALEPYRYGLEGISDWARGHAAAAAALNRVVVNSMRFMLAAAGIDTEGAVGALKIQGLALAWGRVLNAWFRDHDTGLARTMATLDRELIRGERLVERAEDLHRLTSPLRALARAMLDSRRGFRERVRERWRRSEDDEVDEEPRRRPRRSR
ncbi:MAG: TetR/AcrR family transcriptional regulator [Methylobacteriaceae bacterium]|nr:TetR/AcrR family transcriptional regulator [Methylobacteriaceae bacterium]MBV9244181.1 TetR/AcrR family transcriptional regulator [Methylobacteriaceae bacterium]MBV9633808.1 TetR/AcrR family transcriptional regulator [Methylobacteriaceae bacterium]